MADAQAQDVASARYFLTISEAAAQVSGTRKWILTIQVISLTRLVSAGHLRATHQGVVGGFGHKDRVEARLLGLAREIGQG